MPHEQNSKFRKFKTADGRHFKNGFIGISQPRIIRFQSNLMCWCKFWFQEWSHDKKCCKFKMADGRHIENCLLISPRFIVRLMQTLIWRSRITFRHRPHSQNSKFQTFEMTDGRHFENFCHLLYIRAAVIKLQI